MSAFSNLLRYSVWNFSALVIPLFVGLATIPWLLHEIGIERFGVLTIMWAIIGYFSLFDFGVSKALTKKLAEGREQLNLQSQRDVFWTAIQLMAGLGLLGFLVLLFLLGLDNSLVRVSSHIQKEVDQASLIVAVFIPIVVVSAGLRGTLEAYEKFRETNILRLALGVWMYLAPAVAGGLGYASLPQMAMILVLGRVAAAIASWRLVTQTMSGLGSPVFVRDQVRPLFAFGAWITVSGIVGPLMTYLDRFWVAASVGAMAVAYYATPQDVATKLFFLPIAINAALLPMISRQLAMPANERGEVDGLLIKSIWLGLLCIAPFCAAMLMFPSELLTLWLGVDFATHGSVVIQVFGIGVFFNVIGIVLVSFLYASGQPSWVARLHLVELPLYFIAIHFSLSAFGFIGVAGVWSARILVDTLFLWHFTVKLLPVMRAHAMKLISVISFFCVFVVSSAQYPHLYIKLPLFALLCSGMSYLAYQLLFRKPMRIYRHEPGS